MKTLNKIQLKKFNAIKATSSKDYQTVKQLLNGHLPLSFNTGQSGYSKGWANKSIWTAGTSQILNDLGIKHECGNDAPKGGANGEFITITDKAFIKRYKALVNEINEKNEKIKADFEAAKNAENEVINNEIELVKSIVDEKYLEDKQRNMLLSGKEKANAFVGAFSALLKRHNIEITNFYKVMRAI